MKSSALRRRRSFTSAGAVCVAVLALAAPAAASGPPFAGTPTIDGGYGVAADPDSTLVITGEKANGFVVPQVVDSASLIRGEKANGFEVPSVVTPVAAPAPDSGFDWSPMVIALALGVALSMLVLLGLAVTRTPSRATVAQA